MKLKSEFIVHNVGEESLLVPTGAADWAGVVRGNRTLGAILSLLLEETDEGAIVDAMRNRFDAPEDVIARDVSRAIEELRGIGALDE